MPIVEGLPDAVDVVVSGHTHQAYNCVIDGKIVTSAGSAGRLVTDIDLQIDPVYGDVLAGTARNVAGRQGRAGGSPADRADRALPRAARPAGARQVGTAGAAITRDQEPLLGARGGVGAG